MLRKEVSMKSRWHKNIVPPKNVGYFVTMMMMVTFARRKKDMLNCLFTDVDRSEEEVNSLCVCCEGLYS